MAAAAGAISRLYLPISRLYLPISRLYLPVEHPHADTEWLQLQARADRSPRPNPAPLNPHPDPYHPKTRTPIPRPQAPPPKSCHPIDAEQEGVDFALYLAYISPISRLHLAYISPTSRHISEQEGVDFAGCIDLSGLTRVFNPRYSSYTHFGLDHVATAWRAPPPLTLSHRPMPPPGAPTQP